jgi:hypothetical protein
MQFRVTYCLPLVGLGITVLCVAEERSFSVTRLRSLAYVTIGFVGAWIAVVIVLAAWGILPAYFENVYFSGWKYVSASHSFPGHRILKSFVRGGPAMLIGFIGMTRAFLTRSNAKTKTMALCSVCDLGGALLSTHWYGHYFIQPLIPFSILTVYSLKESLGPRSIIPQVPYANLTGLKGKFRFTAALFVFSLCCAFFYQVTYVLDLSRQISNERSGLMSQKKAARYIRESTDPSDYLIAHGSGSISGVYFLSHRRAASKHFYTLHFGKKFGEFSPWQESVFREYLAEIRQNRPSFVVLYKEREIELPEPYGTEFLSWLNESYVHEKTIDPYEMWHRR